MNCNCNNKNNSMKEAKIKHVFGNVLRIAIPLTLRTVELVDVDVDGEIEKQAQVTDTDFIPSSDYPVNVVFNKGAVKVSLKAQMRDGNIAYVEDKGKISVGTYDITVTCNDNDGNPYRFKQNTILQVVDATADAGIATPIEYEVTTWYLDAAIYLVMKGEDGVGIEDIITESSGEIGGVNTITFVLTNGETRSFTILNGSGSVDSDFDENSLHPLSNSVITNKFKSIDANIAGLFGDVDYDSSSKILRFWDITKSTILATVDARPFIKDGMVNRVYIQNRTLVITFNADSGHDTIAISLDSVFNPNNYYTRVQTDNRIADEISSASSGLMTKAEYVNEDSNNIKYSSAPEIVLSHIEGVSIMEESHSRLFGTSDGHIKGYAGATGSQLYDYGLAPDGLVFLDKTSGLFYRWDYTTWQQVGDSSGGYEPPIGGIPKTDLAQSVQDTLDDVSNKVDKVAGKGLSTEDYTTAEKQKLAGLSNYDDTEIQAEVDAKYEKPNTGIPKTDLASGVQASLGKADTALQSSDLEGYATTDDVDDAVAALVSSAPQTLDTLNELAEALGDDPNFATTMATQLGNKVDKETGKGLSTNDYTTAEKNKLAGLENYDDSALQTAIDGKVDKESGKSLMTDAERTKLQGIAAGAEVNVQPNWTQANTSADDYIKNKPTLATVATSGSYNDLQDKPTIPAAQVQSDWNATTGMGVILNKPTIPDTSTLATKTELNGKQDTINDLASIRINSGKGVADMSSNADGTVVTTLANGDTYTLDLNHEHPQYVESTDLATVATTGDYDDLTDKPPIPTKVSDLQNDSGFTTNTGTLTGVTFNGTTASVSSGVAAITATIPSKVSDLQNDSGFTTNTGTLTGVSFNGTSASVSNGVAAITASIPTDLGDLTNNAGYTKNTGTITGITMNNVSKGTSGVVDLGTVITAHQDISGKANASEVYTKTQTDTLLAGKQDTLTSSTTLMTINGNAVHYGESVTVQGEKGDKGDTGDVQVDGNGNVLIYNGRDKTTTGAALDASQGQFIGKILNAKDNTFYNVWVGTANDLEELEALEGYEDNTIYLVGVEPTIAQRFNVTFSGGDHTSVPASTQQTVKEGSAFSVIVSPASGYTIDSCYATMGNSTIQGVALTGADAGKYSITINNVTGAISIKAAATIHITGITVSAETRTNNSIPLSAVVAPPGAENVTLAWSVDDTTNFGISGSGTSATLTIKSGASNSSVTITCQDTNASSDTASGTLQLTGLSYAEAPITEITDISATRTSANTLTLDATADSSTPTIEYSLVGTMPTVKQVRRWDAGDEVDGETQAEAGSDLIDVPAVVLSGNTLTYKDDCQVTLKATAGNVESSVKTITITHDSADAIWFEDDVVKGLLLTAGFGSNGEITYTQAAASVGTQTNNQAVFKNNTTIIRFNEWQYFTNSQFNVSGCTSLTSVILPKVSGLVDFDSRFGLGGSHGITGTVIIPEGYTKYGATGTAFSSNPIAGSGITKVVFPSTFTTFAKPVTSLPYVTELDLTNTSLNSSGLIASSVKGDSSAMPRLATIKLPNSLTSITTQKPFRQLAALTRIEFGNAFTSGVLLFDDYAFMTAVAMTYVFNSTTPPTAFNFASNQNGKRTVNKILVPRSAVDTYKESSVFSSYVDKISAIEDEEA